MVHNDILWMGTMIILPLLIIAIPICISKSWVAPAVGRSCRWPTGNASSMAGMRPLKWRCVKVTICYHWNRCGIQSPFPTQTTTLLKILQSYDYRIKHHPHFFVDMSAQTTRCIGSSTPWFYCCWMNVFWLSLPCWLNDPGLLVGSETPIVDDS